MILDAELKLKLAKAARDLAAEIEAGTGPTLGVGALFNHDLSPCCVMGHVYNRAGMRPVRHRLADALVPENLPIVAAILAHPVENANDALAPWSSDAWFSDAHAAARTPLPQTLRDYAFAIEGL